MKIFIQSDIHINGAFLKEGELVGEIDMATGSEKMDELEDEREFGEPKFPRCARQPLNSNERSIQVNMGKDSKRTIMGNEPNDNAAIRIPPPLFFFACLGIGLLLEYLSPIHLVSISLIPRVLVGGTFILISIYFALSGFVVL